MTMLTKRTNIKLSLKVTSLRMRNREARLPVTYCDSVKSSFDIRRNKAVCLAVVAEVTMRSIRSGAKRESASGHGKKGSRRLSHFPPVMHATERLNGQSHFANNRRQLKLAKTNSRKKQIIYASYFGLHGHFEMQKHRPSLLWQFPSNFQHDMCRTVFN